MALVLLPLIINLHGNIVGVVDNMELKNTKMGRSSMA
jgi:hypothetical protein